MKLASTNHLQLLMWFAAAALASNALRKGILAGVKTEVDRLLQNAATANGAPASDVVLTAADQRGAVRVNQDRFAAVLVVQFLVTIACFVVESSPPCAATGLGLLSDAAALLNIALVLGLLLWLVRHPHSPL